MWIRTLYLLPITWTFLLLCPIVDTLRKLVRVKVVMIQISLRTVILMLCHLKPS